MKRVLLAIILLYFIGEVHSQTIFFQNFSTVPLGSVSSSTLPGWDIASNTPVREYYRPGSCSVLDKGLQTPGVGKNAPTRFILPTLNYDATNGIVTISFKIYVYDANLNCTSVKDFPCPTYVGAYLVKSTYSGGINSLPAASDIYATASYQLVIANGNNTIVFNNPAISDGTPFRIYLDFKTAENSNCTAGGTKFIFDDFETTKSTCGTADGNCSPVANDDYFDANNQTYVNFNTIKANVFGGFALWASQLNISRPGFTLQSLPTGTGTAVNNGLDYDNNNHNLSLMSFNLKTGPFIESSSCGANAPVGTLSWNGDGSFTYSRADICVQKVSFTYNVTDPSGYTSGDAKVTIVFPPNIVTPVTFSGFAASRSKQTVALKWETATEQNNRGFYVQRNTKGVWENIAFVFSAAEGGNSNSLLSYSYNDANSEQGISQYRIQQVDMDGKASYSVIRSVKGLGQAFRTVVYPNPSSDGKVNVVFEDQGAKSVTVSDMSGRVVRQYHNVINNLHISGLESGMYSIQVTDLSSAVSATEKVIIKKR